MEEIRFVDTTVRDGQQSLWALAMRTGMIRAAPAIDATPMALFEVAAAAPATAVPCP